MSIGLMILCAAAVALVAFSTSALTALALWLGRHRIRSIAPTGKARLYFAASLAPLFIAAIVLTAVFAPSFGWIADHCGLAPSTHHHPHVCTTHPASGYPALGLIALGATLLLRFALVALIQLRAWTLAHLSLRRLLGESTATDDCVRVLPIESEAHAFVLGLVRPTLFVTQSLTSGAESSHLSAVLAHERAHIRRGDPLKRFVAKFALAFHLPIVGRRIDAALARSQELAADSEAAVQVGSDRVARALIALSRRASRVPRGAFAFSNSEIEARIVSLLEPADRPDRPKRATVATFAALAVLIAFLSADPIHHGLETLLGAFGA